MFQKDRMGMILEKVHQQPGQDGSKAVERMSWAESVIG